MIRPDLLKAVIAALDSHRRYFSQEDFVVAEYESNQKQPCLSVQYRYDPGLFFNFHIPTQRTRRSRDEGTEAYRFNGTLRPGRESVEEVISAEDWAD